jgi:hypothetical protein
MRPMKIILFFTFISIFFFSNSAFCMEITGTVLSISHTTTTNTKGTSELEPVSGAVVKAITSKNKFVARGKTDAKGFYSLNIPEKKKNDVYLISADTSTGVLRSLFSGKKTAINPFTEILTWRILESGMRPDYFTTNERQLILKKLYEISTKADFSGTRTATGTVTALLDLPELNLLLGNLTETYRTQGDNIAKVETIKKTITKFLQGFIKNDVNIIRNSLSRNPAVFISGETLNNTGKITSRINAIHNSFKDIRLDTDFLTIRVGNKKAEVTDAEHIYMKSKDGGSQSVNENWIARNNLLFVNGKWKISKRDIPKCKVENAAIVIDGHIADWTGIKPCYYQQTEADTNTKRQDGIKAMYFAKSNLFLFWRIDLDTKPTGATSKKSLEKGIPKGLYTLFLLSNSSGNACNNLIYFVNNSSSGVTSGAKSCLLDIKGNKKEQYFSSDPFAVGSRSIEGVIPIEKIKFFAGSIYAFSQLKKSVGPDMPAEPDLNSGGVDIVIK